MIGMPLVHKPSGTTGKVDATTVSPDGKAMARIADKWFLADELQAAD